MLCSRVRGQGIARGYFQRALASGRVSHAYLLVGPAGVGKSMFATELAAAILCRSGKPEEGACEECLSCRTLRSGNHPAFLRVTPPPGKKIDIGAIRETIEALSLRAGDRRVVVIDDIDRMLDPAANALLKTLEEPGPGTVFLLITDHPAQLLATIHSRCHRVPFVPLAREEFDQALADADRANLAELPELYRASGGAPGTAVRLLEGIEACGGMERFRELLAGQGAERPESLPDYLPLQPKEAKRDRIRRFLDLCLLGTWGYRDRSDSPLEDAQLRIDAGTRALHFAELMQSLDGYLNPELLVESAAEALEKQ